LGWATGSSASAETAWESRGLRSVRLARPSPDLPLRLAAARPLAHRLRSGRHEPVEGRNRSLRPRAVHEPHRVAPPSLARAHGATLEPRAPCATVSLNKVAARRREPERQLRRRPRSASQTHLFSSALGLGRHPGSQTLGWVAGSSADSERRGPRSLKPGRRQGRFRARCPLGRSLHADSRDVRQVEIGPNGGRGFPTPSPTR